ncbi:hypothetical protein BDV97DRAFT_62549 [Delphinella strobiligena]|nr:hypothetical protein BDV97DRAFT_62549 [Delphinella strobiligena]
MFCNFTTLNSPPVFRTSARTVLYMDAARFEYYDLLDTSDFRNASNTLQSMWFWPFFVYHASWLIILELFRLFVSWGSARLSSFLFGYLPSYSLSQRLEIAKTRDSLHLDVSTYLPTPYTIEKRDSSPAHVVLLLLSWLQRGRHDQLDKMHDPPPSMIHNVSRSDPYNRQLWRTHARTRQHNKQPRQYAQCPEPMCLRT